MRLDFGTENDKNNSTMLPASVMVLDPHDDIASVMNSMARPTIELLSIPAVAGPLEESQQKNIVESEEGDNEEEVKEEEKESPAMAGDPIGPDRTLQAKLYLPPHLKKEDHVKYPLVLHV